MTRIVYAIKVRKLNEKFKKICTFEWIRSSILSPMHLKT